MSPKDDPLIIKIASSVDDPSLHLLKLLLNACIDVLQRQLRRYIEGDLSNPTPQMIEQAQSAPSDNMASERALAMTDSNWRRAPNATAGFINGKIKCRLNRTLEWLEEHPDCQALLRFAVKEGYKARRVDSHRKAALDVETSSRQDDVARKRDTKKRKDIEKGVAQLFESGSAATVDDNENVQHIVSDPEWLIGQIMVHNWEDDGIVIPYYGRFKSLSKKTPPKKGKQIVKVMYWKKDSIETLGEEYSVTLEELVTDILLGDLLFL